MAAKIIALLFYIFTKKAKLSHTNLKLQLNKGGNKYG